MKTQVVEILEKRLVTIPVFDGFTYVGTGIPDRDKNDWYWYEERGVTTAYPLKANYHKEDYEKDESIYFIYRKTPKKLKIIFTEKDRGRLPGTGEYYSKLGMKDVYPYHVSCYSDPEKYIIFNKEIIEE